MNTRQREIRADLGREFGELEDAISRISDGLYVAMPVAEGGRWMRFWEQVWRKKDELAWPFSESSDPQESYDSDRYQLFRDPRDGIVSYGWDRRRGNRKLRLSGGMTVSVGRVPGPSNGCLTRGSWPWGR